MKIVAVADAAELGRAAASLVADRLRAKPAALLTLPTGNTPLPMFRELVRLSGREPDLFAAVRIVALDEYAGLDESDRRSLGAWLRRELLDPAGIGRDRVIGFDPQADAAADCARMEAEITGAGGIDLAVLGLGPNGHLGLNEPGASFEGRTAMVALTPASIASNARYWGSSNDVPRHGLTLGLGTLFAASSVVLIVSGDNKAAIVAQLLGGPIGEHLPATCLRRHPDATLLADLAALQGSGPER